MEENKPVFIPGVGWRREVDGNRHHRENLWDYKGRAIYHITLATEGREALFGRLSGNSEKDAHIEFPSLGEYVVKTFRGLPAFYAKKGVRIRILALRVMPDHLHGVIHVLEPMPKSIGEVVRSFKSACTSWYKREVFSLARMPEECMNVARMPEECVDGARVPEGCSPQALLLEDGLPNGRDVMLWRFREVFAKRGSIWEFMPAGYHERILHCEGQLERMISYVKDNPRRLWLKRHNPELFRIRNDQTWSFVDAKGITHSWRFRTLGNMFLMNFPHKQHIQCSRSIAPEDLEQHYCFWRENALQGVVSISSAISEGEKIVTRRLREEGLPLVVMLKDGFPPVGSSHERYYKPGGVYFDACAAGRLLLVEPYPEVLDDGLVVEAVHDKSPMALRGSLRYHFLALNKIGEMLAEIG